MSVKYYDKFINLLKNKFKVRKITKPQKIFIALCQRHKVVYQRQYYLCGKFYDFYLPQYNVLVEVDGTYWHGKGLKHAQRSLMQQKNYINDIYKNTLAKVRNIKLYRFWQGQITNNSIKKILSENKKLEIKKPNDNIFDEDYVGFC